MIIKMMTKIFAKNDVPQFAGNKAKGRISKRVFQQIKVRQTFRKTSISYTLIPTVTNNSKGKKYHGCHMEAVYTEAYLGP